MRSSVGPLSRAHTDLEVVLAKVDRGTAERTRRIARVDLALEHATEWIKATDPGRRAGQRGGSSTAAELADRTEDRRVHSQALRDHDRLDELVETLETAARELKANVNTIEDSARELEALVRRNVEPIDHGKLPTETPGCVSCARAGHFAPVRDDAKRWRLCDWCYRYALAARREKGVAAALSRAHWPPEKAVDVYHRRGAQAAGRHLAQESGP